MADIEVLGLVKRYGDLVAVDGVSFRVENGEVFGMLGPNGAGKTTTLEIVEGLRSPDAGSVRVLGTDVLAHPAAVKERIGVQLQATALPVFTRVREAVELFASLYPRSRPVQEVMDEFNLGEKAGEYTNKLSGGQMQRLSIALALINDPDVVFLDEPTTGLDPQARLNIWSVIEQIRKRRKTVVLTTHYMEEAERLCDRVAVIDHGRIVAMDTPRRLVAEHAAGTTIEFEPIAGLDAETLRSLPGVDRVAHAARVSLTTRTPEAVLHALLDPQAPWARVATAAGAATVGAGASGDGMTGGAAVGAGSASGEAGNGNGGTGTVIRDLMVRHGTLEDVFLRLTGRSLRE
ncbi:MAG TPA: ABC transporter ATP-binding protein [Candidatus Binatia bacterium]|nr:ABC transporter ATP-binding protein [Candidatus Binatia bacterium]